MLEGYYFSRLGFEDLDAVLTIEEAVYSHPWSRGNFVDSLCSAYHLIGLRDGQAQLIGYFLLMPILDEMHLLNLAVGLQHQGRGNARTLLVKMQAMVKELDCSSILLEVRASNLRAMDVYKQFGFLEIGRRKGYYPAAENTREDALVMRLEW